MDRQSLQSQTGFHKNFHVKTVHCFLFAANYKMDPQYLNNSDHTDAKTVVIFFKVSE